MAVTVPYTHTYDRLMIPLKFLTGFLWFFVVMGALGGMGQVVLPPLARVCVLPEWLGYVVAILYLLLCVFLAGLIHQKVTLPWLDALSARLYISKVLATKLPLTEAKLIAPLLSPGPSGKWYCLTEVLELPATERREALLRLAVVRSGRRCAVSREPVQCSRINNRACHETSKGKR